MFNIKDGHERQTLCNITLSGKTMTANMSYYGIDSLKDPDTLKTYRHLNEYLDYEGEEFKHKVFHYLSTMLNLLEEVWDKETLDDLLRKEAVVLMDMFSIEKISAWLWKEKKSIIPLSILDVYDEKITRNRLGSREQTYLKSDYCDLIALAMIFKVMSPIWSEYISRRRKELGTNFKERYAFSLISGSKILFSNPYNKLYSYIERMVNKNLKESIGKVMAGISTEDLPSWTVGVTVVRRLTVAPWEARQDDTNLITNIYGFATSKMRPVLAVSKKIRNKVVAEGSGNENDKTSSLENYKIVCELPPGTIEELDFSVSNYREIFDMLSPSIPDVLIKDAMTCRRFISDKPIGEPQLILLKWTLSPVINHKAIEYLSKKRLVELLCVTSAILWHRGHKYLSLLAVSVPLEEDGVVMSLTGSRSKVNNSLKEALDKGYPYRDVKKSFINDDTLTNIALKSINSMIHKIDTKIWSITAKERFVIGTFGELNRRPAIPYDIRGLIANFIIEISERQWRQ